MPTDRAVVDASVLVEVLGEFAFPRQARTLLSAYASESSELVLWVPDLAYVEAAAALRRLVAAAALEADEARRGLDLLLKLPLAVVSVASLLVEGWALRNNLTSYDACYVVLARQLGCPLITADEPLSRALSGRDDVLFLRDLVEDE